MGNTALYTRIAESLIRHTDYFFREAEVEPHVPPRHLRIPSDQTASVTEDREEQEQVKGNRSTSSAVDEPHLRLSVQTSGDSVGGEH